MYYGASPQLKKALENYFGRDLFEPELITNYEDACKAFDLDPDYCKLSKKCKAFHKLEIIAKSFNEGNQPIQQLYAPYFEYDYRSGLLTIAEDSLCSNYLSIYYYRDAEYAGDKFIELYKDLLL